MELLLLILLLISFLPVIIASHRNHRSVTAIFVTCLFFGWSGIGFIITLIWSLNSNVYSRAELQERYEAALQTRNGHGQKLAAAVLGIVIIAAGLLSIQW